LSTNHWNENKIDQKNAALVRNMPLLSRMNFIEPKSIRNTLVQSKNNVELKAMTTGDSESDDSQQQEDMIQWCLSSIAMKDL
jgi:hypothetical protein